jgi:polyisoprenoid-binding protein YceI
MKIKFASLLALTSVAVIVGCSKNPAENVPAAEVKTPAPAAAPALVPAVAKTYAFGPETSAVDFIGSKVTGSHKGSFKKFTGELNVVGDHLVPAGNKVVIEMDSLTSDADRLTGHLKGADFFDVSKFPTATFTTTAIEKGATNSTITGNLTLHGVTKQISFPADIRFTNGAVNVTAEFFLNRFDFDIKYAGKADDLIRQEVVLKLKVVAAPKQG